MAEVVDNSQNGFMAGISNIFDGVSTGAGKILELAQNWSFYEDQRSAAQAETDLNSLRANLALTSENNKYLMAENTTRIISYVVLAGISIAALYTITKVLK